MNQNGIYKITNSVNGKVYIGSTFCKGGFKRRWIVHKSGLKRGKHPNKHLQSAWNKYGEFVFIFELIEIITDYTILLEREQYYIDSHQSFNDKIGYNISKNASAPMLGRSHTEESKKKIGKASEGNTYALGYKASDETKAKMSKSRQYTSQETRNKRSLALMGNRNGVGNKNVFKRPINQLDLENNIIKSWSSIIDAVDTLKLHSPNIIKVCNGKRNTCGGFKWKYIN
jgi:group I intron endonuclease